MTLAAHSRVLSAARTRRLGEARANAGQAAAIERPGSDFYATPWHATRAGLDAFGGLLPAGDIEEPFAGRGDIVKVLREPISCMAGRRALAADLHDWAADAQWGIRPGVDFLRRKRALAAVLISNPPYSVLDDIIRQCDALGFEWVAFFVRLGALSGDRRGALLAGRGLRHLGLEAVFVSAQRVTMYPGLDIGAEAVALAKHDGAGGLDQGSAMDTAWIVLSPRGRRLAQRATVQGRKYWWEGGLIWPRHFWRPEDGRALLPINIAGLK